MSTKKKEGVQPRVIWTYQETEDLIEIMQSKFISKIVANRNCRKLPIFEEIRKEMNKYGHDKTTQQILFKYKNLCAMYRSVRQTGKRPPIKDKRFEFYDKMHELFSEIQDTNGDDLDYYQDNFSRSDMLDDEEDYVSGNESRETSSRNNNVTNDNDNKNHSSRKRKLSINDEDPLGDEWNQMPSTSPSAKRNRNNKNDLTENEVDDFDFNSNESYNNREERSYDRKVNILVRRFLTAQLELQKNFFQNQQKLQLQQQEWEERTLDIEREFLIKVLKS